MHGQRASNEALVLVLVTPTAPRKLNSIKARMRPQKEQSLLQQDRRREYYIIHLVLGASDRVGVLVPYTTTARVALQAVHYSFDEFSEPLGVC